MSLGNSGAPRATALPPAPPPSRASDAGPYAIEVKAREHVLVAAVLDVPGLVVDEGALELGAEALGVLELRRAALDDARPLKDRDTRAGREGGHEARHKANQGRADEKTGRHRRVRRSPLAQTTSTLLSGGSPPKS